MPNNVLIFRLVSNEIIAAQSVYNSKDRTYHLIWPVEVYFKRLSTGGSMIGLYPWLVTEIIQMNSSVIEESKVMTINHPTEKFIEYYDAMVRYYEKHNTKELAEKQLEAIIKSYDEDTISESDFVDNTFIEEEEEERVIKPKSKKDKKLH
jgi:hypothetical protein